jgi:threonine/homoserine/homoserine lactone efflux protein
MNISHNEIITLLSIGFVQLLAVISPGPSFLVTARTAVARSRREGIKVAAGLAIGTVLWSAGALFGLNILFHAVPALFMAMKLAGALFLLWIALQIFRNADQPLELGHATHEASESAFWKGFWIQISNPKVVVFFGSVFVAMLPENPPLWMLLALLLIVSFNEFWWYSAVALFFGAKPVRALYLKSKVWIDRVTGLFLGVLGLRLLWSIADRS